MKDKMGDLLLSDDMTPDQRAEYQRLLASPTATAMALIEAREEITRLKDVEAMLTNTLNGVVPERNNAETLASVYASKIAALKVELAAMMKQRDEWKHEAECSNAKLENVERLRSRIKDLEEECERERKGFTRRRADKAAQWDALEKARDAALTELSQVRAERDMYKQRWQSAVEEEQEQTRNLRAKNDALNAAVKRAEALSEENARLTEHSQCHCSGHMYWRDETAKYKALLGRAVAALRKVEESRLLESDGVYSAWELDQEAMTAVRAILADAPQTRSVDTWRLRYSELAEQWPQEAVDYAVADATATQAADAWRAQQEERAELEAVYQAVRASSGDPGDREKARAVNIAAAKVDARRGGGR